MEARLAPRMSRRLDGVADRAVSEVAACLGVGAKEFADLVRASVASVVAVKEYFMVGGGRYFLFL